MRFGLCTGDFAVIERADRIGLDYLDIGARTLLPFDDDATFAPVAGRLRSAPVPVEAVGGFIPAEVRIVGPTVEGDQVRRYLEVTMSRAASVGVQVVNWGSSGSRNIPPGFSVARAFEQIERYLHLVADIAQATGLTVVIEPINPLEGNVIHYVADALLLAQAVNRPEIRVLADYYHVQMQNEPMAHITAARGWLAHTHTAGDGRHYPQPSDRWEQGRFLAALCEAGYDGRVSLECRVRADVVAEATVAVAHLRAVAASLPGSRG